MSHPTLNLAFAAATAITVFFAVQPTAGAAQTDKGYGCFRANTSMNIRARPWASSDVIATANPGDLFIKRKRFCNIRGYWCAITTTNGIEGYGDKSLMDKSDCK